MRRPAASSMIAFVAVLSIASGSSASADSTTTSVPPSTTTPVTATTVRPKPVWVDPLTGLPDPRGTTRHRSALTIKIENTPEARPQYGVDQADVVYEEIVEGGITRLAAIFDNHLPVKVGPVRSVRRTDREIVSPVGGLFAFSGGAPYALQSILSAPVKIFDESTAGAGMFRDPTRYAPHNLYANARLLMSMGGRAHTPQPLFRYAATSAPAVGIRVAEFIVNFVAGYGVTYQWNARARSWQRSIFGKPDVTADGVRLSPVNVIVMKVTYDGGVGRLGAEAQLVGSGAVDVFSDGRLQKGRWSRSRLGRPTQYTTPSGKPILLRPGQTWVELLDSSMTVSTYGPR